MTIDWSELAGEIIGLGAPLIGTALGGPLGGAAGKILADALGAREPTPSAIREALAGPGADRGAALDAVRQAETEFAAALAKIGVAQVEQVGETQRAEIASDDPLQRWWRPLYALELSLIECPAFALTLLRALWTGHDAGIAGFGTLSALLIAYFAARFGVLGVYVSGRSREKQSAATGQIVPGVVGQIVKAVVGRR